MANSQSEIYDQNETVATESLSFPYLKTGQDQYLSQNQGFANQDYAFSNLYPTKDFRAQSIQDPRPYQLRTLDSQRIPPSTLLSQVKETINFRGYPRNDTFQSLNTVHGDQVENGLRLPLSPSILRIDTTTINDTRLPEEPTSASSISESVSPSGKPRRERNKNHTPRPSNSFILYRREKHIEIMAQYKGVKTLNNNVISKIVANMWRSETPEIKARFAAMADAEKSAHMLKYPDYKYRPRKSVSKKQSTRPKKESKSPSIPEPEQIEQSSSPKNNNYMVEGPQLQYLSPMDANENYHHMQMQMMEHARMSMMGHDQQSYELMNHDQYGMSMNHDQYGMSPTYGNHPEYMQQDNLFLPTEYANAWPMVPANNNWDLGLEQRPFGSNLE